MLTHTLEQRLKLTRIGFKLLEVLLNGKVNTYQESEAHQIGSQLGGSRMLSVGHFLNYTMHRFSTYKVLRFII